VIHPSHSHGCVPALTNTQKLGENCDQHEILDADGQVTRLRRSVQKHHFPLSTTDEA
jgi:hypothetical protein